MFNKTVKCLEGNFITILDVYNIMNTLKKELIKRKEDLFFGYETRKKIKELELLSPELTNKIYTNFLLFIDKSLCYLDKWFNFNNTNWLFSLSNFNLKTQIKYEHFVNIIELLNLQKLKINMDNLYSEILVMNELLAKIINCKDFTDITTAQKWQYIFNHCDDFSTIYKVISYLLSVPATSAFTERVFSVMNLKWREERNKASLNLIKNKLLIYFNINIDCKDAVEVFKKDKHLLNIAKSNKKYVWKNK